MDLVLGILCLVLGSICLIHAIKGKKDILGSLRKLETDKGISYYKLLFGSAGFIIIGTLLILRGLNI